MKNIWELARETDCTDLCERLSLIGRRTGQGRGKYQCPFHDDTNPSMVTYPMEFGRKSHFYCFTCQEHGDAMDLYAKVKNVSLKQAAYDLAKETGCDGEELYAADRATVEEKLVEMPEQKVQVILAICEEWRRHRIDRAEQCMQACLAAMEKYADPDDWRWKVELHMAGHYQDEASSFRSMTPWEMLYSLREELENLGVTPYGRVRFAGEVH